MNILLAEDGLVNQRVAVGLLKKRGDAVVIACNGLEAVAAMERESFENEAIAALLNRYYVAIKVDREERPDIDRVYMAAVQAIDSPFP